MNAEDSAHPAAELFPLIEGQAFDDLVADITTHGLQEPIVRMPDGRILDGRNRYRACLVAQVEPKHTVYDGADPWSYVVSKNLRRRQLTDVQRAMVAARLAERSRGGSDKIDLNGPAGTLTDKPPKAREVEGLLNVSHGAVKRARTVHTKGTPALVAAVESGVVTLTAAEKLTKELPKAEQDSWVQQQKDRPTISSPASSRTPDANPDPSEQRREQRRTGRITGRHKDRHSYVRTDQLYTVQHHIQALNDMLDGATEGLDPAITPDEAAEFLRGLAGSGRPYCRLRELLTQRKDQPT